MAFVDNNNIHTAHSDDNIKVDFSTISTLSEPVAYFELYTNHSKHTTIVLISLFIQKFITPLPRHE